MNIKAPSGIMLTLLLASMLTLAFNIQVLEANPIPVPSIWMPEEYIDATIFLVDGVVQARVNGTYPFAPLGTYYQVMMYYPVPPDADRITVEMNETKLDWTYGNETYPTVLSDWPMINWTVKPVPEYFEIETYYEHPIPVIDGNYTFLYAMGTGKYLDYYAKETIAYVSVNISKHVADKKSLIDVYTIGYNAMTEEWTWNPADYIITEEDETWIVTLTVISEMFHPLIEDLLVTIKSEPTTWTVDDDGPADFHTIQDAINAANPEDTIYVYNGTYCENVIVNKTLVLIGESKYNTIIDGNRTGTVVDITADNVSISGFTIRHSVIYSNSEPHVSDIPPPILFGIRIWSSGNKISHNIITSIDIGIDLWKYSSNNSITGNNIANHTGSGIRQYRSSSNTVSGNNITNNQYGINLYESSNNRIYHNNFLDNTQQAYFYESGYANVWDNGWPSGGNYWSDYEERYPDAEELDGSGIWDTSYLIDEDNQDRYPLMGPWSPPIERKVGVKVCDWPKYEVAYNYTSNDPTSPFYHPEFAYIEHFKTEVLSVSGTNITFRATTYFENGTEVSKIMWIDISTNVIPIPSFFWGAILFTAANLTAGDTLTPNPYSDVINATLMRTYAGAEREVNFVYRRRTSSIMRATPPKEQYIFDRTTSMFWDRATGVLVEANDTTKITTIELDRNYRPLPGGYVYVTNIFTQMTLKETNIWSACVHELAVTSLPITGITFTINGTPQTTPYTELLLEGSYTLEMPETHGEYVWSHWLEDGDTNRIKTVTMNTDISLTAVFTPLDTTPPTISIVSPENKTYTVEDVPLTFTLSESTSWIGYSLDGQANITIAGNTTLTDISDGMHSLVVYASDIAVNLGSSDMVYFTVDTTPPIADAGSNQAANVGTLVTFDASGSTDNVAIVSCEWNFGDGTTDTGITCNHTYTEPGNYTATLTVKDAAGNLATDTIIVTVIEEAPAPFPWWILGPLAAVMVGIVAVAILWRRRKYARKGNNIVPKYSLGEVENGVLNLFRNV